MFLLIGSLIVAKPGTLLVSILKADQNIRIYGQKNISALIFIDNKNAKETIENVPEKLKQSPQMTIFVANPPKTIALIVSTIIVILLLLYSKSTTIKQDRFEAFINTLNRDEKYLARKDENDQTEKTTMDSTETDNSTPCDHWNDINYLRKMLLKPTKLTNTTPPKLPEDATCTFKRKVHDVVIFSTELDTLEIRLYELYDVVDVFHIIESNYDFHGRFTEPMFTISKRYEKFMDKIQLQVVYYKKLLRLRFVSIFKFWSIFKFTCARLREMCAHLPESCSNFITYTL